jgi:hypothetical protein
MADGIIDCTPFWQMAVDSLFLGSAYAQRKRLIIPTGRYRLDSDFYIPSNAVIVGENMNETVVLIGRTAKTTPVVVTEARRTIFFKNANNVLSPNFTSGGQLPINVQIANLTIDTTLGQIDITGLNQSIFSRVKFNGGYAALGDAITLPAVVGTNTVFGTRATNIEFDQCKFQNVDVGIKLTQSAVLETIFKFNQTEFNLCGRGAWITGLADQQNLWTFDNCTFTDIATQAFWSEQGIGTSFNNCNFTRCGNGNSDNESVPDTVIVQFGQNGNNTVNNCSFTRAQIMTNIVQQNFTPSFPEVLNGRTTIRNQLVKNIQISNDRQPLTLFSSSVSNIHIDYTLTLATTIRTGTLTIAVDLLTETAAINDSYRYTANPTRMEGFEFSFQFENNKVDPGVAIKETFMLYYTNPSGNNAPGVINFTVRYSV